MSGRNELPSGLVTFMFTDIEGSTRLARLLGAAYGTVLGAHRKVLRTALSDFAGFELFTEGDSFFVAFGDASSALAACVVAQRALFAYQWPGRDAMPRVRMGLHTGWATPADGEYASPEVHRAARVAAAAHGGQILCSEATTLAVLTAEFSAARPDVLAEVDLLDLGSHRLRGFDDDDRLFQILGPGLDRDFPRPRTAGAAVHNLPASSTSFVGRRSELGEVAGLLARHRLVTIAGPGGSGKTRLSLAVAERLFTAYPQGVWTIDVATAAAGLVPTLAAVLGVRAEPGRPLLTTLIEQCAQRRMLLIVQTCDAAPVACAALVRRLLAGCVRLDVLVTGQLPLGVPGEAVWRIPALARADAVALLTDRTAAAGGDEGELWAVAARLEGSPLAIELAATRLRLLSGPQLTALLDDPLAALEPVRRVDPWPADPCSADPCLADPWHGELPEGYAAARAEARQYSLAASLDWSYRTLSRSAVALVERLVTFAEPVDLDTVQWCGPDALSALAELAEKSLVEVIAGPCYRISAFVRAYVVRRLAVADERRTGATPFAQTVN